MKEYRGIWMNKNVILIVTHLITFGLGIVSVCLKSKLKRFYNKCDEIENLENKIGIIYELANTPGTIEYLGNKYELYNSEIRELIGKFNKYKPIANTARAVVKNAEELIYYRPYILNGPHYKNELEEKIIIRYNSFLKECNIESSLFRNICKKLKTRLNKITGKKPSEKTINIWIGNKK